MRYVSDKSCRKIKSVNVFSKIAPFINSVEIYCRTGQARDDDTMHAHCLLDT